MKQQSITDGHDGGLQRLRYKAMPLVQTSLNVVLDRHIERDPLGWGSSVATRNGCSGSSAVGPSNRKRAAIPCRCSCSVRNQAVVDLPAPMIPSTKMREVLRILVFHFLSLVRALGLERSVTSLRVYHACFFRSRGQSDACAFFRLFAVSGWLFLSRVGDAFENRDADRCEWHGCCLQRHSGQQERNAGRTTLRPALR